MPWPMIHFAIAANSSNLDPSPSFLIGSIAPDAIHMRDHMNRKDKGMTHLVDDDGLPNIEKLTMHCLDYLNMNSDEEWQKFVRGYFAHIYTDARWTDTIYADFKKNYCGDLKDLRCTYNQEVSQMEFQVMRSSKWAADVLQKLKQARAFSIAPFVTEEEVRRYRDAKLQWILDETNEPKMETVYFREDTVNHFIMNTSQELIEIFKVWKRE